MGGSTRDSAAGAGEELFGALSSRALTARALSTFALASATCVLGLERAPFAVLYALDLGLRMVLAGSVAYARFNRAKGYPRRSDAWWGAFFLGVLWLLFVFLPVTLMWVPVTQRTLAGILDWRFVLGALVVSALAWREARHEARRPEEPGATLYKPVLMRALCVAAFVFFGPGVFSLLSALGAGEPAAMALTYAASETYPFVATLIDRGLHRLGPAARRARAPRP